MKVVSDLLDQENEIKTLADDLRRQDRIAFDTEFIREKTFFPNVEIIQVATKDKAWIVDARIGKEKLRPLLDVFTNKDILKIVHAGHGDQECLYTAFGIFASPTLDTSIAAGLCGLGEGVGLGNLLKDALGVQLKKGHARTNWAVRPLPAQLAEYALLDVQYLVSLGDHLLNKLDQLKRKEWALELSAQLEDKNLYDPDPEALALRLYKGSRMEKRSYFALIELMRWRERRVRELNVPRRWVADDHVLLDLARVRPKDQSHLSAFRGLNQGELKKSGMDILRALKVASEKEELAPPKAERLQGPNPQEEQVMELLRCYVGLLCDEYRIALKFVLTANQILPLIRSSAENVLDLVQEGHLSSKAAELIGTEVIAFLKGKRALSVKEGQVEVVRLEV